MTDKQLNIKSSTIEKGLELAKEFLSKLIGPTTEEVGLLISDNIKYLRFKNQVRILLKAKNYVEQKNIDVKSIPIKILVPLLEQASLEDDNQLQDKWANMLVNLVDSETNLQNQIFPYLLSQISIQEFNGLKTLRESEYEMKDEEKKYYEFKGDKKLFDKDTREQLKKVNKMKQEGFWLHLEEFEIANIQRLGLIRQLPPRIYIEEFSTGGNQYDQREQWHELQAKYDPDDYGYRITELGMKFLKVCELDNDKSSG